MAKNKGGYILEVLEVLEVIVKITLLAPWSPVLGSSPLGQSLNIFPNLSVHIPGNETPNISKNGNATGSMAGQCGKEKLMDGRLEGAEILELK